MLIKLFLSPFCKGKFHKFFNGSQGKSAGICIKFNIKIQRLTKTSFGNNLLLKRTII